jgi:drug/metabolite transporter (DMT)-like permease
MRVLPIVFSYSMMGIITSIFLKNLDSLLKIFAVSVEIVLIAVMGWIIFGETVNFLTFVSIVLVALSIYVYAVNPVNKFDVGQKSQSKIIDLSNDADPENGETKQ